MAIKTVKCPHCGKMLQTDDSLEKTICLYCGTAIYPEKEEDPLAEEIKRPVSDPIEEQSTPDKNRNVDEKQATQLSDGQPSEKGGVAQQQASAKTAPFTKAQSDNSERSVGVLYSEASDDEKKNPKKLSVGNYIKELFIVDKTFLILMLIGFVFLSVGLIVLTEAFHAVAIGIVLTVVLLGVIPVAFLHNLGRSRCGKCKTDLKIADVYYEKLEAVHKRGSTYDRYRFNVKCPVCGKEKTFDEDVMNKGERIDLTAIAGGKQKTFSGKRKPIILLGLGVAILLGLILLVIGSLFMITAPAPVSKNPMDYYGTYEVIDSGSNLSDYSGSDIMAAYGTDKLLSLVITKDTVTIDGALARQNEQCGIFSYEYASPETVKEKVENPKYSDKSALLAFYGNDKIIVIYILTENPYSFEFGNTQVVLGTKTSSTSTNSNENNTGDKGKTSDSKTSENGNENHSENGNENHTGDKDNTSERKKEEFTIQSVQVALTSEMIRVLQNEGCSEEEIAETLAEMQDTANSEMVSTSFVLNEDGTCEFLDEVFTWEKTGTGYIFKSSLTNTSYSGRVVGNTIVVTFSGLYDGTIDVTLTLNKDTTSTNTTDNDPTPNDDEDTSEREKEEFIILSVQVALTNEKISMLQDEGKSEKEIAETLAEKQATANSEMVSTKFVLNKNGTCKLLNETFTWKKSGTRYIFKSSKTKASYNGILVGDTMIVTFRGLQNGAIDITLTLTDKTYIPVDNGATILNAKGFAMTENSGSISLPNATEAYSFIDQITVSKGASWVISTDIYGMNTILTRTLPLNVGDNTVYLLVSSSDGNTISLYTMTVRRRPIYTVNFETNGGTEVDSMNIEELSLVPEPTTTRMGYTFAGWDYDFADPIMQSLTISASWTANADTPYKIKYYRQNLEDDNYTLTSTTTLTGTTDTTANAVIKTYNHFTFSENGSILSGNIDGDGNRVLEVYYTRDKYDYSVTNKNIKGGSIYFCTENGTYKYDTTIHLSASAFAGYDFMGWYVGETRISKKTEYSFQLAQPTDVIAKWYAREDTPYKVEYYLQNLENNSYTLTDTDNLTGTTDTTANAEVKTYNHFTFSENGSVLSGNIDGNGSRVLKVYYTRDQYAVSISAGENVSVSNTVNGTYKYGYTLGSITTMTYPGYEWDGWYRNGEKYTSDNTLSGFVIDRAVTFVAASKLKEEMQNFTFSSTASTCTITGIINNTVTEIIVPDYVTNINSYAFSDCSELTSVTIGNDVANIGDRAFYGCYYLVEVYNKSSLNITKGSSDYGYVGYYAKAIYTEPYVSKLSTDENGYILYADGEEISLIGYMGTATELTLPEGITEINQYAFYEDGTIAGIIIPDSVTSIGADAFYNCTGLTSVYYTGDIASWCGITFGGGASNPLCYAHNLYINNELQMEIVLPDTVTEIKARAFYGWNGTSITIPDSVTSIGDCTFSSCSSLQNITIPFVGAQAGKTSSDTYQNPFGYIFGTSSYTGGTATQQYYYGSSTSEITNSTYYIPSSLRSVTITGGNILRGAFDNCSTLTSITIPDSVTSIGSRAFYGCSKLTSITIPDSVTSIGSSAFYGCSKLTSITIPDSVTSIGWYAFYNCSSLTSITIPDSVTSIGRSAFYGCSSLTSITIPNSVTSIWPTFSGCSSLESITIPFVGSEAGKTSSDTYQYPFGYIFGTDRYTGGTYTKQKYYGNSTSSTTDAEYYIPSSLRSVTVTGGNILRGAFDNCSTLTSITLTDSVTSIGDEAFYGCSKLTSITIPDSVTSIGSSAFYGCSKLTSITIPDSVTSIGEEVFSGCDNLQYNEYDDGYYLGNETHPYIVLMKAKNKKVTFIHIAGTTKFIYEVAFNRCSDLTTITLPDSVTRIGKEAFYNCTGLKRITFTGTKKQWNAISKGSAWNLNTGSYKIFCTDGIL